MEERQTEKKAKYYNPPSNMSGLESIYIAPPWSGKGQIARRTIALSNTCTIDNLLYFIFLAMKNRHSLLSEIQNKQALDKCFKALLKVHQHFLLRQWSQGKISWQWETSKCFREKQQQWDLYGTEAEFMTSHLQYLHSTTRQFICDDHDCPNPVKESTQMTPLLSCKVST